MVQDAEAEYVTCLRPGRGFSYRGTRLIRAPCDGDFCLAALRFVLLVPSRRSPMNGFGNEPRDPFEEITSWMVQFGVPNP